MYCTILQFHELIRSIAPSAIGGACDWGRGRKDWQGVGRLVARLLLARGNGVKFGTSVGI